MRKDNSRDIDDLYENNREIIHKLINEKRLLENVFLDNRLQEQFKKDLLQSYKAIEEIIQKRCGIDDMLRKTKEIPGAIGILYNKLQQKYMSYIIGALKMASISKEVDIICFTIDKVDIQKGVVNGTLISGETSGHIAVSIPSVICNIGCHSGMESKGKIKALNSLYNATVINAVNIFNQSIVFDMISSLPNSKSFLLPFSRLSPSILTDYFIDTNTVFIVPERGIIDIKAIKVKKRDDSEETGYVIEGDGRIYFCNRENLFSKINEVLGNKKYMIMKGSRLLNWNGAPLEARVYIQKGITGKWAVTEMLAKNEIFLNESKYKDTVDSLSRVLSDISFHKNKSIETLLINYSVNICVYLEHYIPGIANCTVDFIIDEEGIPFLTHFGGWEQREFLFKLNGENLWDKYMSTCIDYLIYLKNAKD